MAIPHIRANASALYRMEALLIASLLKRVPNSVTPSTLTAVGLAGSILGAIGLVACNVSDKWLAMVMLGICLNWFGDSLDGSLARYRGVERPRLGFLLDHTCDLFSHLLLIISFGLSPFLSMFSALVVLQCYFLFSAYTYICAASFGVHQMAYGGLGATEFRILMIMFAVLSAASDNRKPFPPGYSLVDSSIVIFAILAVVGLAMKAVKDIKKMSLIEQQEGRESSQPIS